MMSQKKSSVWQCFSKKSKDEAECLICHKILKCAGGSTSGLKAHSNKVHDIDFKLETYAHKVQDIVRVDENSVSLRKRLRTMEQFVPKKSVDEAIAKMACKDGFSFRQIATSEFIQSNLTKNVYDKNPPTSKKGVKNLVLDYHETKKSELKEYFLSQTKAGFRYSISLDEFRSSKNDRFISINVHDVKKHWSLGLIRIKRALNSENTKVVEKRLSDFGLNLNRDIVGVTSYGASAMDKFGEESDLIHQFCLAREIHLTVCDIIYQHDQLREDTEVELEIATEEEEEEMIQEIIEDWDDYDIPLDAAFETAERDDDDNNIISTGTTTKLPGGFREAISKIRKICKITQANSKGKEPTLILDNWIRWNSMIALTSGLIELNNSNPCALRVCGVADEISDDDCRAIRLLLDVLRPFEIAIKGLSSEDASMLKGENSIKFLLKELENHNHVFAIKLKNKLIKRYSSRRKKDVIGLIRYLEDVEVLQNGDSKDPFLMPGHIAIKRLAETTFKRLFPSEEEPESQERESDDDVSVSDTTADPVLQRYLTEVACQNKKRRVDSASIDFAEELKLYEATGKRTYRLEQVYRSVSTIRSASIESERAFVYAGRYVSKISSRLSPKTLDALFFLRSHFSSATANMPGGQK